MIDVLNLTAAQLVELLESWGEPAFRARQIDRWVYRELATGFDAMTDLPHVLRERLAGEARIGTPAAMAEATSADGLTRKALLGLDDGESVETVLMLYADAPAGPELEPDGAVGEFKRRTVCISTQVGCPIGCPFCATGQAGYVRNLTAGEIVAQVIHMARRVRPAFVTNVVIMGMGEPFFKYDVTWQAILSLTDAGRFGLGARRITVSTSGEVPGIQRLAAERLQVNLAISLHAAEDDLRDVLVPLNRKYPLNDLMRVVRAYGEQTRRRVTFEYALMDGVNDRPDQARGLSQMLRGLVCHVNLIPLNPTAASPYSRTPYERVKEFERILLDAGIPTTLRVEKGIEIAAGCGQLRQSAATAVTRI
ncbi:MAG: 23S rRNA (adenine(2503)-C(2))-methyltransferase RlmN [Chloroflexi bacterium]|nr:23S rRNA (adenine(2503)-C(2))-methyltransferase RlmN [Chloroflexota bacterium]